ncbi:MAG: hypothetical protein AAF204_00120 [Pseudomonadota bacterium]
MQKTLSSSYAKNAQKQKRQTSSFGLLVEAFNKAPLELLQLLRENHTSVTAEELGVRKRELVRWLHETMIFEELDKNPEITSAAARFLRKIDRLSDARVFAEVALELEPENSKFWAIYAEILIAQHDAEPGLLLNVHALHAAHEADDIEYSPYTEKLLQRIASKTSEEEIERFNETPTYLPTFLDFVRDNNNIEAAFLRFE